MMLRDVPRRVPVLSDLRDVLPMMHHRLNRLAVFCYTFSNRLVVSEIVAHAIPRENFRRHQARADIPAVITQHEFVKPGFPRSPIFLGWNEDGLARSPGWAAKNKGVHAIAFEDFHVGQLARPFFHHDGSESSAGDSDGEKKDDEKFEAHKKRG